MSVYYTGIGSRNIPNTYFNLIVVIAEYMAKQGYILRSGGADGSDNAFEIGCDRANGKKEIYLPWKNFNGNKSNLIFDDDIEAINIAKKYHPAYNGLSQGAKRLIARNGYQVLGKDLKTPSKYIICYTDGTGGTSQALRIAEDIQINIPIFNLYHYKEPNDVLIDFKEFLINPEKWALPF